MVPLSKVCKDDPSKLLCFDACPIKVLRTHYSHEFKGMVEVFSRIQVCKPCKAVEGKQAVVVVVVLHK
jgi:hypothetical protein